jgi:hypothetical protein
MKRVLAALTVTLLVAAQALAAPFAWVVYNYDLTDVSTVYCTTAAAVESNGVLATPTASPVCAALATSGWIDMVGEGQAHVATIEWVTKNATSLDYTIECRSYASSVGQTLTSGSLSAAGSSNIVILSNANAFDQCRIGLKLTTDTGVNSVLAYFAAKR